MIYIWNSRDDLYLIMWIRLVAKLWTSSSIIKFLTNQVQWYINLLIHEVQILWEYESKHSHCVFEGIISFAAFKVTAWLINCKCKFFLFLYSIWNLFQFIDHTLSVNINLYKLMYSAIFYMWRIPVKIYCY